MLKCCLLVSTVGLKWFDLSTCKTNIAFEHRFSMEMLQERGSAWKDLRKISNEISLLSELFLPNSNVIKRITHGNFCLTSCLMDPSHVSSSFRKDSDCPRIYHCPNVCNDYVLISKIVSSSYNNCLICVFSTKQFKEKHLKYHVFWALKV